ncbi:MAG TPA: ZIP family metal transporter [Thermoleophilaceae bacterium]|jgi:ZIP family zinc transporter|nr:ZIP family metal transporter [Thermoleophilaceae bacterium]
MSFGETVILGALAGFTIYLGLPFARLNRLGPRARVGLAMFAVGVLAFLFADIFEHGLGILEEPWEEWGNGEATAGEALGLLALTGAGFAAGTGGLATLERRLRPKEAPLPPVAGGSVDVLSADDARLATGHHDARRAAALRIGMTVAAAIGVHNFAEGLAIGVSANTGEIGLATVLIIGFALHNATEGFGIIGPLGDVRPSWTWLAVAGLIAGGPVFLGTIVGYSVSSEPLELLFYALSGGAILYVIGEVWNGVRRLGHRELGLWLLAGGFILGLTTDMVIAAGGG